MNSKHLGLASAALLFIFLLLSFQALIENIGVQNPYEVFERDTAIFQIIVCTVLLLLIGVWLYRQRNETDQ